MPFVLIDESGKFLDPGNQTVRPFDYLDAGQTTGRVFPIDLGGGWRAGHEQGADDQRSHHRLGLPLLASPPGAHRVADPGCGRRHLERAAFSQPAPGSRRIRRTPHSPTTRTRCRAGGPSRLTDLLRPDLDPRWDPPGPVGDAARHDPPGHSPDRSGFANVGAALGERRHDDLDLSPRPGRRRRRYGFRLALVCGC